MDLYQSVERTRFLGRELLLFLWFESEIFEATLSTSAHGSFGFWVEKELSLGVEKETTRIKGSLPGKAREAKESLLLGKTPEKMGFRLVLGEREASFALRGDTLALSAVSLPTVLDQGDGRMKRICFCEGIDARLRKVKFCTYSRISFDDGILHRKSMLTIADALAILIATE